MTNIKQSIDIEEMKNLCIKDRKLNPKEEYSNILKNLVARNNENTYDKLGYDEGLRQYYYDKGQIDILKRICQAKK